MGEGEKELRTRRLGDAGKSRLGDPSTNSGQAERLGERAKPKADLPQHSYFQAAPQGDAGEERYGCMEVRGYGGKVNRTRLFPSFRAKRSEDPESSSACCGDLSQRN